VAKNDIVRVVVAPGRCIQIPHPTLKLVLNDKKQPFIGPKQTIRPGEFFECTREEADRLERLGTIVKAGGQDAPKALFGSADTQDQVIGASGAE
jgi:hypothetical protein